MKYAAYKTAWYGDLSHHIPVGEIVDPIDNYTSNDINHLYAELMNNSLSNRTCGCKYEVKEL